MRISDWSSDVCSSDRLMISKPLGLSPKGIVFRRVHLYAINPFGVGAMALSLTGSTLSFMGLFGNLAGIYSPVIGLAISFAPAPPIAWTTRGRHYIARDAAPIEGQAEAP